MRSFLIALIALGCGSPEPRDAGREDRSAIDARAPIAEPPWLRDEAGGVVLLRGTNVSGESKNPPDFLPDDYDDEADFARLRTELGMNAIRYLVFWEAIEPEPGVYDAAYLAEVRRRVEAAGAAGLYVLVDMHQDVYGRGFGSDGAPRWTCDEALYASYAKDPPAAWYLGYAKPEVQACFDRLYLDPAIRGAFARAWAELARALQGAQGLFAYELINEPHWGSSAVRTFELQILPSAYAEWIDAIRAVDPDPYVFIEPSSAANVGLPTLLAPPDRERLVFAPHIYPPGLEQGSGWTGDRAQLDGWIADLRATAARLALPISITELGARAEVPGAIVYLEQVYGALDGARTGAMQWDASRGGYGLWTDALEPGPIALAIARPHPSRTAGVPISFSWDGSTFVFEWEEDGSASGDTIVTVPRVLFPTGAQATLADGGEVRADADSLLIPPIGGLRRLEVR